MRSITALSVAGLSVVAGLLLVAACGGGDAVAAAGAEGDGAPPPAAVYTVRDTVVEAVVDAAGVANAVAEATLSTKLMGSVEAVLVREGDRVTAGEPLVRIDARELRAKRAAVGAAIEEAESMRGEASRHAVRLRALYADSAAPKAQLEAAESALERAESGVRAARAREGELAAVEAYATIRAPFGGVVTARYVDEGAFAAPGAPLVTVQDPSRLRIAVTSPPDAVRRLARGDTITATLEGDTARAIVEGVVPAPGGNLYRVNALIGNAEGRFLPGSAATLALRQGRRAAVLVPAVAVVREGDLTGVRLWGADGEELRWVRLGRAHDGMVEVVSGLRAGDRVLLPVAAAGGA